MKQMLISAFVIISTIAANAQSIQSEEIKIAPSSIDQSIRLVDKKDPGSTDKKLSIIVTDRGMSTDVSPRYSVLLAYSSLAEMGNITADFKISENAFQFISASRISAGIYEVKTVEYRDDGMYDVKTIIDATKMFSDEKKAREACGGDFCDQVLKSTVQTKVTAKLLE